MEVLLLVVICILSGEVYEILEMVLVELSCSYECLLNSEIWVSNFNSVKVMLEEVMILMEMVINCLVLVVDLLEML